MGRAMWAKADDDPVWQNRNGHGESSERNGAYWVGSRQLEGQSKSRMGQSLEGEFDEGVVQHEFHGEHVHCWATSDDHHGR
jgi:hypothetical protein